MSPSGDGRGYGLRQQRGVGEGSQFHQPDTIRIAAGYGCGGVQRQASFAHTARTGEGNSPGFRQVRGEGGNFVGTADEGREGVRQVVGGAVCG